jgi:cytochrome b
MENESVAETSSMKTRRVFVWDVPVRLFHWTLLALMVGLFVTAEVLDDGIDIHARLGMAVLALVMFRVVWGIVGSSYARFSQFVRGPGAAMAYARTLFVRQHDFVPGHNPLGGWMVVMLLVLIMLQAVLGLYANDDILFEGPLMYLVSKETSDLLTELHEVVFHVLLVLVVLHVAAVLWHRFFKGDNLVSAMFTGYKALPLGAEAENASGGGVLRALVVLVLCAAAVWWVAG